MNTLQAARIINLTHQKRWAGKKAPRAFCLAGLLFIPLWQLHLKSLLQSGRLPIEKYQQKSTHGVTTDVRPFAYFDYYLGLYPLTTSRPITTYSKTGAEEIIQQHGDSLLMESGYTIRYGDHGRIWLYLFDAWRKGGYRDDLNILPAQQIFLSLSLMLLFAAFWYVDLPILGALIVLFVGSNPYLLYETYVNENAFGLPQSVALSVLAVHTPLIFKRRLSFGSMVFLACGTAVFLGTLRQIRTEDAFMVVSVILLYAWARPFRWNRRLSLVTIFLVVFGITLHAWESHFNRKIETTQRFASLHGGHPFPSVMAAHHMIWHTLWCGLGDFGEKYGYDFSDIAAASYVHPILDQYVREHPAARGGFCWDSDCHYLRYIFESEQYQTIVRDKVLYDISHDPLWYIGILAKRTVRILSNTTPVRITLGTRWISFRFHGFGLLAVILLLISLRQWRWLMLSLFTLPLALPALLIYSGEGMTYYSIYPQITTALILSWILDGVWTGLSGVQDRI